MLGCITPMAIVAAAVTTTARVVMIVVVAAAALVYKYSINKLQMLNYAYGISSEENFTLPANSDNDGTVSRHNRNWE